ncbi:hypothetical protein B0H14DRAFT_3786594 [Mycena olivaceomarginata]|nr:hypothetical protein B0H14DRAFT_3786594 [Mycena olivaceomarginata]
MAFGREISLALALALVNPRPGQSQLEPKPEKAKAKPKSHGFLARGQSQNITRWSSSVSARSVPLILIRERLTLRQCDLPAFTSPVGPPVAEGIAGTHESPWLFSCPSTPRAIISVLLLGWPSAIDSAQASTPPPHPPAPLVCARQGGYGADLLLRTPRRRGNSLFSPSALARLPQLSYLQPCAGTQGGRWRRHLRPGLLRAQLIASIALFPCVVAVAAGEVPTLAIRSLHMHATPNSRPPQGVKLAVRGRTPCPCLYRSRQPGSETPARAISMEHYGKSSIGIYQ